MYKKNYKNIVIGSGISSLGAILALVKKKKRSTVNRYKK